MKECELCNMPARMYCESDQASLCWDCDAKVHCANFLVARHSRSLLCHACQMVTPWKATGANLGRTVSVCEKCSDCCNVNQEIQETRNDDEEENDDNDTGEEENDDEDDDSSDDDDDDDDEEDGDNQVVPWASTTPPPPSSSSSEESSGRFTYISSSLPLKRMRENVDLPSQDDLGCSSSRENCNATERTDRLLTPLKERKKLETVQSVIVRSLKRFEQNMVSGEEERSRAIFGLCKLSKDPRAVDNIVSVGSTSRRLV